MDIASKKVNTTARATKILKVIVERIGVFINSDDADTVLARVLTTYGVYRIM